MFARRTFELHSGVLHSYMMFLVLCMVILCFWIQCVSTLSSQNVLISRCLSELDVHYIDEWLQYHIHIGFESIIIIDDSPNSVLEDYGKMYSKHLRLVRSGHVLTAELLQSIRSSVSVLYLNINEYLVLKDHSFLSSMTGWPEINCLLFGSNNLDRIDWTSSTPYSIITRFTSRSNTYAGFTRRIRVSDELTDWNNVEEKFYGAGSLNSVVNISMPYVAMFASRTPEEFLNAVRELVRRLELQDSVDPGLDGLLERFLLVLTPEQLEQAITLVKTKPEVVWLSEISRITRHLDANSVPDFSLAAVYGQYTGSYHNPTAWFDLMYTQPQNIRKAVTFAVNYELLEICEREYQMLIHHTVIVFDMQPGNVHRIPSIPSEETVVQDPEENQVAASKVDNNSLYFTLMHHLLTLYPCMKVSLDQLNAFMEGFIKVLIGSTSHLNPDGIVAAMLVDFNGYYEKTVMTNHELVVSYHNEKRHEASTNSCFTSFYDEDHKILQKDFMMLVIHHDNESLDNIRNHLDLSRLDFVVPARINSSVFFEYVVYRDFLPDVLPELEHLKYVLVTTHSTLINVQPVACGYEVARLLSVAYRYDYDVVPLLRSKHWLMPTSINMHTLDFKLAWDTLLTAMGYSQSQIREYYYVTPLYRNSFIIKPHRLRELTILMRRAIFIAQNNPVVNEVLSRRMGFMYVGSNSDLEKSASIAQHIFNTSYYQLFPFVFERLPVFFLLTSGASICQHNDDCYTPEPDPIRPLTSPIS